MDFVKCFGHDAPHWLVHTVVPPLVKLVYVAFSFKPWLFMLPLMLILEGEARSCRLQVCRCFVCVCCSPGLLLRYLHARGCACKLSSGVLTCPPSQ